MEERLHVLYQTVYFDKKKITIFLRVVQDRSSQNLIVFGADQYLVSGYLCLNINYSLNSRIYRNLSAI